MSPETSLSVPGTADTFEARWQRWQEAGVVQDARLTRSARLTGVLLFCGIAVWLAVVAYGG
jgi:hypothetical protein